MRDDGFSAHGQALRVDLIESVRGSDPHARATRGSVILLLPTGRSYGQIGRPARAGSCHPGHANGPRDVLPACTDLPSQPRRNLRDVPLAFGGHALPGRAAIPATSWPQGTDLPYQPRRDPRDVPHACTCPLSRAEIPTRRPARTHLPSQPRPDPQARPARMDGPAVSAARPGSTRPTYPANHAPSSVRFLRRTSSHYQATT